MRTMNVGGRLALALNGGCVDVETASGGRFGPDVQAAFAHWDELRDWAEGLGTVETQPIPDSALGAPAPLPPQVFAVGLNYRSHAVEGGIDIPSSPMVFTKFPASVTGPVETIELPEGSVDYEAELVVVIGRGAYRVPKGEAWSYVAGLTVGQDISERQLQLQPPAPQQFSLSKSHKGFSPIGPVLVTPEELDAPDDLELGCRLNGTEMQKARTGDLIFSVPTLVSYISSIVPLLPGDAIFTGTPEGVGFARDPKVLIGAGDVLETYVDGIGAMTHRFAAAAA